MANLALRLGIRNYDHVAPLAMGDVTIEGAELSLYRGFDALQHVTGSPDFQGGEGSFSRHVQRLAVGDTSFVGIPAFVMREFRHRCFFIRKDSDIRALSDLAGKRIGTDQWPASGNTWARAILRDAGIAIEGIRWTVGPVSRGYRETPADTLPPHAKLAPEGRALDEMLLNGDLDALMCPWVPEGFYEPDSKIKRLFADFKAAEQEYYQRTKIHPGHHIVILRRELVEQHPWVVRAVFTALDESRKQAEETRWRQADTVPWMLAHLEETTALMGRDFRAYGLEPNRHMIAAFCDEQVAQGLVPRRVEPEEVFADFERLMRA